MPEKIIFALVVTAYLAAAIVGVVQLLGGGAKYKRLLLPLVCLAIALEAVLLVFRAVDIKAVPLTGLFESMLVLTIVFGLIYLFLSIAIRQVWFGSVLVWIILAMVLLAGIVAEPATEARAEAATGWAIAHGIAMILGGASMAFATTSALLYLLGRRKLKRKKVMQVLGRVPNIERLEHMNQFGLMGCFVLMTLGLTSGIVMAVANSATIEISVFDAKIVLITATWVLIGSILILRRIVAMKGKTQAYMTIITFILILCAFVVTTIFCSTGHVFNKDGTNRVEVRR